MEEFLLTLTEIDATTFNLLAALSLFAAFLVMQGTSSILMAVAFLPGVVAGGLLSNYAFTTLGIVLTDFKTANIVIALTAGMIPGALLMLMLAWMIARLREALTNMRYNRSLRT